MYRKTGRIFMVVGALLIIASAALLVHNILEDRKATDASEELLRQLAVGISENDTGMIDGYEYIGILTIPALELELPVMAQWDYERLRLAPCLYYGSVESGDMVIAAHNYDGHFGRLRQLEIGDAVLFTDMKGNTYDYQVGSLEILPPTAVEEMIESEWDLSLYTCTYGGRERVTVRCERTDSR